MNVILPLLSSLIAYTASAVASDEAVIAIVGNAWIASASVSCVQMAAMVNGANISGLDVAATGIEIADTSCFMPIDIAYVNDMRALAGVVVEQDTNVFVSPDKPDGFGVQGIDDVVVPSDFAPDASAAPRTWGLDRIDQSTLPLDKLSFSVASKGAGAVVYIIDTGVYAAHADFGGRARSAADFIYEKPIGDNHGHGTHTSATAIGATLGVARGASVKAIKVLSRTGSGTISSVIRGIEWAVRDARLLRRSGVLSMSLGGGFSTALNQACIAAGKSNIVVVAAGNSAADACYSSPASAGGQCLKTGVVTVAASTTTDQFAFFSNTGRCVDIAAPGLNILSASITSRTSTRTMSGTSMSAPHVSGVLAVLLAKNAFNRTKALKELMLIARKGALTGAPAATPNLLLQTPGARRTGADVPFQVPSPSPSMPSSCSAVLADLVIIAVMFLPIFF